MASKRDVFDAYYCGLLDAIYYFERCGGGLMNLNDFNVDEIKLFISRNPSYATDIEHLLDLYEEETP